MLCCGRTDIGRRRKFNQDSFICEAFDNGMTLCVVCDGMGGAAGGGLASGLACGYFTDSIADFAASFGKHDTLTRSQEREIKQALCDACSAANRAVYSRAEAKPELHGMGTTLVAALHCCGVLFTLNVGDSRMYLIHSGKISQVTKDHSYVQYLVDQGKMTPEEAKRSVNRNIITKAVGTEAEIEPDVFVTRIKKSGSASEYIGILCSDGLTNHVPPEVLCADSGEALDAVSDRALGHVCEKLIDLANDGGGADNITAVVFTL